MDLGRLSMLKGVQETPRKRLFLFVGVGVALLLILQFGVVPWVTYVRSVGQGLERVKLEYATIESLVKQYEVLSAAETVAARAATGQKDALFAHVELLARQLELTKHVESMRPQSRAVDEKTFEDEVQVRFRGLTQKQLIDFLYAVEFRENSLLIKSLGMKKDAKRLLDVDVTVSLLRPIGD